MKLPALFGDVDVMSGPEAVAEGCGDSLGGYLPCRWVWQVKLPALVGDVISGTEAVVTEAGWCSQEHECFQVHRCFQEHVFRYTNVFRNMNVFRYTDVSRNMWL